MTFIFKLAATKKLKFMLEETKIIYGKRLKVLRINQFISQEEMAIKFNISQQSYSAMERGETKFSVKKIEKICKIFKIPLTEFITINTKQRKTKKEIPDSYSIRLLKKHYERLLLEKDVRIGDLEIENKHLKKDKKISKKPPEV